jgi:hypothetical protein
VARIRQRDIVADLKKRHSPTNAGREAGCDKEEAPVADLISTTPFPGKQHWHAPYSQRLCSICDSFVSAELLLVNHGAIHLPRREDILLMA